MAMGAVNLSGVEGMSRSLLVRKQLIWTCNQSVFHRPRATWKGKGATNRHVFGYQTRRGIRQIMSV